MTQNLWHRKEQNLRHDLQKGSKDEGSIKSSHCFLQIIPLDSPMNVSPFHLITHGRQVVIGQFLLPKALPKQVIQPCKGDHGRMRCLVFIIRVDGTELDANQDEKDDAVGQDEVLADGTVIVVGRGGNLVNDVYGQGGVDESQEPPEMKLQTLHDPARLATGHGHVEKQGQHEQQQVHHTDMVEEERRALRNHHGLKQKAETLEDRSQPGFVKF